MNRPGAAERGERAWALCRELLKIDTSNPPGDEWKAAGVVEGFLAEAGLKAKRLEKAKGRSNVVCSIGKGPDPLLLVSHLDVVPAEAARWSVPPFAGVEKDGYLYGRGAVDMKGFAAMTSVLFCALSKEKLPRELRLVCVADEEAGCEMGSKFLVEKHPELARGAYMLGEGGGAAQFAFGRRYYPIGRAEKGHLVLRARFSGRGGHASIPHPDNPVFRAGAVLAALRPGCLPVHGGGPAEPFLEGLGRNIGGFKGLLVRAAASPVLASAALSLFPDDEAAFLRSMIGHTVSPTMFRGSAAINVIPGEFVADLDVRVLPGYSAQEAKAEVERALGGTVETEILEFTPGCVSRTDTPLFERLVEAVEAEDPEAPALPCMISGFTDASWFSRLGAQCYGFSPLALNERDAKEFKVRMHGHDERVAKDAFLRGYLMLENAVRTFLGN